MILKTLKNHKHGQYCLTLLGFLLVSSAWAQLLEPASTRSYYVGSIGEAEVQMSLTIDDETLSGHYYYDRYGVPLLLSGSVLEGENGISVKLSEEDEDGNITGKFIGTLSSGPFEQGSMFEGSWQNDTRELPFSLERVAQYVTTETRQGSIEAWVSYPFFTGWVWINVNDGLQEQAISSHRQFVREGQQYFQDGELWYGWTLEERYDLQYYSLGVISLLKTTFIYTGGAHPNTFYNAFNYVFVEHEIRELELSELFKPESDYLAILNDYVLTELGKQEAVWVVNGDVSELTLEDLSVFSLSPRGLEFAFSPYAVGPYVQGAFFVTLPFEVINEVLDPALPIHKLVDFPASGE